MADDRVNEAADAIHDAMWTKDRWKELQLLRDLVRECRSVDTANRIVERLRFIIKTAEKLDRTSFQRRRQSFLQFLQDQALADLKPPEPPKEQNDGQ